MTHRRTQVLTEPATAQGNDVRLGAEITIQGDNLFVVRVKVRLAAGK